MTSFNSPSRRDFVRLASAGVASAAALGASHVSAAKDPHDRDSGAEFYGTKGQMFLSRRGKLEVLGERNAPLNVAVTRGAQDDAAHVANFCAAIRGGGKLNADALIGHLSTSLCHLGNIAARLGRSFDFDPATEHALNDKEADDLCRREYRDHWGMPRGV